MEKAQITRKYTKVLITKRLKIKALNRIYIKAVAI